LFYKKEGILLGVSDYEELVCVCLLRS